MLMATCIVYKTTFSPADSWLNRSCIWQYRIADALSLELIKTFKTVDSEFKLQWPEREMSAGGSVTTSAAAAAAIFVLILPPD